MNIAKGFRSKREEYDLEQQELAQRAGISKSMICAIEKGQRMPSLETVIAVAEALHCSIDELLDRKVS
ncbi:MAG: helix-turn-helix domain-containing protein [Oscillospiraceae bacterium]